MCKYDLLALQRTIQLNSVQQLLCRIASTVTNEEDSCEMRWVGYGLQSKLVKLQIALKSHRTFQLPCTHVKIQESDALDDKEQLQRVCAHRNKRFSQKSE